MAVEQLPIVWAEVTDPEELARAHAQDQLFERNWAWLEAHAAEVYTVHRDRCVCVSGEELFVADTPQQVLNLAKAAYPEDDSRFTLYIPRDKRARTYVDQRRLGCSALTRSCDL
jgi:hypothetical protein